MCRATGPAIWVMDDVLSSKPPVSVLNVCDVRGKWANEDATVLLEFNRFYVRARSHIVLTCYTPYTCIAVRVRLFGLKATLEFTTALAIDP